MLFLPKTQTVENQMRTKSGGEINALCFGEQKKSGGKIVSEWCTSVFGWTGAMACVFFKSTARLVCSNVYNKSWHSC
jgi:hypothetical protein